MELGPEEDAKNTIRDFQGTFTFSALMSSEMSVKKKIFFNAS